MDQVRPELSAILHEIERALQAKLYYVAIAVALSVPDVCACLECDPDKPIWATFEKYVDWCNANIKFVNLDGADLARLRGGVLHQGHFDHPKSKFNRVLFIGPESQIKAHDVVVSIAADVSFSGVSATEMRMAGTSPATPYGLSPQITESESILRACHSLMDDIAGKF
jgi:hypothetical protein